MMRRVALWIGFALAHFGIGVWASVLDNDALDTVVVVSIYLPLWLIEKLGLPLYQTGQVFPSPTLLGWAILSLFWLLVYWYVAGVLARVLTWRMRAA
jgi:hypothetical protein